VPKKTKTEAITDQNMASPEGKPSKTKPGRKPAGSRVAKKASSKKAGARRNTKAGKKAAPMTEPSDEEISIRAYFISERRRRFGLPGDASSDWLEAKKQLLSETGPR
jgi:hypothetical protein